MRQISRVEFSAPIDGTILREMEAVAAHTYTHAAEFISTELRRSNILYTLRDSSGSMRSFFLVGWGTGAPSGESQRVVMLGLSVSRPDSKGTGSVIDLYNAFFCDARDWEIHSSQKLLLWFFTGSPAVASLVWRLFPDLEPRPDGSYSPDGADTARRIVRAMGFENSATPVHPFVLKGVVLGRYSAAERERIGRFVQARGAGTFGALGVDERQGDRLLFLGVVPSTDPPAESRSTDTRHSVRRSHA